MQPRQLFGQAEIDMSNGSRRIGLFGAVGILVAAIIIAGFMIVPTIIPSFIPSFIPSSGKGILTVLITDKPVELEHLNITIDWIRIQDHNEVWHDLTLKRELFYFDLLALQDASETLSETEIDAGNYTMIRMHVLTANATYADGTNATLTVPSDVIKVLFKPQLSLEDGGQVTVLIDLQPEGLNSIAISRSLNLRPVIKAIVP